MTSMIPVEDLVETARRMDDYIRDGLGLGAALEVARSAGLTGRTAMKEAERITRLGLRCAYGPPGIARGLRRHLEENREKWDREDAP